MCACSYLLPVYTARKKSYITDRNLNDGGNDRGVKDRQRPNHYDKSVVLGAVKTLTFETFLVDFF